MSAVAGIQAIVVPAKILQYKDDSKICSNYIHSYFSLILKGQCHERSMDFIIREVGFEIYNRQPTGLKVFRSSVKKLANYTMKTKLLKLRHEA